MPYYTYNRGKEERENGNNIVVYKLLQMAELGDREYSDFSILDLYSDDI